MVIVAAIIVVFVGLSVIVGYSWLGHTQLNTSWVEGLNQLAQTANPYPNATEHSNPNVLLSYSRAYLYENGTSELVEFGNVGNNSTNPTSTYLNNLLLKANLQLQPSGSISSDFLDKATTNDKIVEVTYRLSVMQFGGQQRFYVGYFVLKDNLNEDLVGKIIVGEVGKQGLSLWAISK